MVMASVGDEGRVPRRPPARQRAAPIRLLLEAVEVRHEVAAEVAVVGPAAVDMGMDAAPPLVGTRADRPAGTLGAHHANDPRPGAALRLEDV